MPFSTTVKNIVSLFFSFLFYFFFRPRHGACDILVTPPGIEPLTPASGVQRLNHRTTKEVPKYCFLMA